MLRVSTRGEYGVRLMVDLARHYGGTPRSLSEISQSEGLELKVQYLEQLVRALREHGLVESTRGAHGGYRLSRAPEDMRMSEILRALEGPIAPMICATEGEMEVICGRLDGCSTKYLWAHVRDAISAALDSVTLADLVHADNAESAKRAPDGARLITLSPRLSRGTALDTAGRG
ncbi:MAG TPA: Rrf2 family transcriptional regulator [Ktedonobacterales bacterium]|nr:Rrf2 family transcriptional regulator [Ktedonobacterales bacterium]